ncbi:helix-turn-helix domain-containing protein [Frigidibacter sp. MR17.24]|uniref:helix-turn-helix domain-containing protein n=1 Tax=Frigidibacter sp. MR17.24 TaxID=3127345 RepID=UPI003012C92C
MALPKNRTDAPRRRAELAAFLRAKRKSLSVEDFGLTGGETRLVRGLRREEIAMLSGVPLTFYTWLEQGRMIPFNPAALPGIARALCLSGPEQALVAWLAGLPDDPQLSGPPPLPPGLRQALDGFRWPAVAVDPAFEMLGTNAAMGRLLGERPGARPFHRNLLWQLIAGPLLPRAFEDPAAVIAHCARLMYRGLPAEGPDRWLQRRIETFIEESPPFTDAWGEGPASGPAPVFQLAHAGDHDVAVRLCELALPEGAGLLLVLLPAID